MNSKELRIAELPLVALRGLVVFPNMMLHFDVGRKESVEALKAAAARGTDVFLIAQKNIEDDDPTKAQLSKIGVVATIRQVMRIPNSDNLRIAVEGKYRASISEITQMHPYMKAVVKERRTSKVKSCDKDYETALVREIKGTFEAYSQSGSNFAPDVILAVLSNSSSGDLADYIASNILVECEEKQAILDELNPIKRMESLCVMLEREFDIINLEKNIHDRIQEQIDKNQREYYLREQLKAISVELNDGEDVENEIERYREKIKELGLEKENEEKLLHECDRLSKMQNNSPESTVIRTYLDTCISLPWNKHTEDSFDLNNARKILDRDHYGLEKIKERMIEMLAVRKNSPDITGQIICLVGPPGVGKTSIVRGIAEAMGRKYARISLGGIRDEAEIRGHRKTYIGSMPGRIINALIQAGSSNALILLDEIDKLGADYKGDPSSALLEALDGEQNFAFRDHYIELPIDLSKVLFITTANDKSTIPPALLDRMEIIELGSYTAEEKFHIAKDHLLKKQILKHGLNGNKLRVSDDALREIIDGYTREAGVRQLEREIATVCRKATVKIVDGIEKRVYVTEENLESILGPKKFLPEQISSVDEIGVANGLAWTSVGGEMLEVEVAILDGSGKLELTGSLGDVMKESAATAVSVIRNIAKKLGIDENFYKEKDIHIHVPEGAVPKDGPSAGITIATALASALMEAPIKNSVAMTGEITLRGRVLPIGGLKEKSMAAYKKGIKTVIIPSKNACDLVEIDKVVKDNIDFVTVDNINQVLDIALVQIKENEQHRISAIDAVPVEGPFNSEGSTLVMKETL